ncbi:hypothetical protein SO802_002360 [Lithocarpus litseifolius]|uniref:Uncharacterized protein n=1 Tax=Lithocarpus litseifolius TaxID=425828 RepID=A0AAW2E2M8_9ROSI
MRMVPRLTKRKLVLRDHSPMLVYSNESFNVGGISETSRESSGGTLPFMIHRGYQCSTMVEKRYLAIKAKLEELAKDNEDFLGKIFDMMDKVSKLERLHSEAKENTKAITVRKEALKKELPEAKKKLEKKEAELSAFVTVNNEKI